MIKISFKDLEGNLKQQAWFDSMEEAIAWKEEQEFSRPNWKNQDEWILDPIDNTETKIENDITFYKKVQNYIVEINENFIDQDKINAEAEAFLANSDWFILRYIDSGVPVPEDIKIARAEARARIIRN